MTFSPDVRGDVMPTNLLDSINSVLTPDLVGTAATALGESPVATGKAVGATVPVILGGLVRGASDGNLMAQVMDLLKSPANDGTVLRKPELVLDTATGRPSGISNLGNSFLSTLFGGRLRTVTDAIAQYAGVRSGSSGSLLSMLAPVVLGVLGERVKRDNLDVVVSPDCWPIRGRELRPPCQRRCRVSSGSRRRSPKRGERPRGVPRPRPPAADSTGRGPWLARPPLRQSGSSRGAGTGAW